MTGGLINIEAAAGMHPRRLARVCTRRTTVLQGFARVARRTSNGVGLPRDVVVSILVMASLELEESVGYSVHI
jgi:hypothetical protein